MDFGHEVGCRSPYFAAPPTSARVQNRVDFVELAGDMSSNCSRSHWNYRLERSTRVVPEVPLYMFVKTILKLELEHKKVKELPTQ